MEVAFNSDFRCYHTIRCDPFHSFNTKSRDFAKIDELLLVFK